MPNTEVKLIFAYDTWRVTAWENWCRRLKYEGEHCRSLSSYCLLAQSVEHMTVNHGVVSSSLTEAAIKDLHFRKSFFILTIGEERHGQIKAFLFAESR